MSSTTKWLIALLLPLLATGAVWGIDARIQQQMGTIVEDKMDMREIDYLEHTKRQRDLTEQERRDLDYYKERMRLRGKTEAE